MPELIWHFFYLTETLKYQKRLTLNDTIVILNKETKVSKRSINVMSINEAVLSECYKAKLLIKMYEFSKENGELDPNEDALSVRILSETIESIVTIVERDCQTKTYVLAKPTEKNTSKIETITTCNSFAERLRLALAYSGMTQMELAKKIGVSQSTISQVVNKKVSGVCRTSVIAKVLGVARNWLAYGEGKMTDFRTSKSEEL